MSMRRLIPVFILILMTTYGPLSMLDNLELEQVKHAAKNEESVHDVPDWRIGDKWVYETLFDVAGLIQQANVSASINTLSGDTTMEVVDIRFETIQGTQTLVYELDINGEFTSGNSGATLEGISGRLEIDYEGTDILLARDLSVWSSEFFLGVNFAPYNIGFLSQNLADITFTTVYEAPREKYDFPLRTGDQWTSTYESGTNVTGTSDYFDPTEFDTPFVEDNTTYQVTADGTPSEDGSSISYSGCSNSYKVNNWNNTGTAGGFEWYCPAVRSFAWYRIVNPAGFQIDWKLKTYSPTDTSGGNPSSSPGIRNAIIDVTPEFIAILPNAIEEIEGHMTVNGANEVGTNLQLRYETDGVIMSLTTDSDGKVNPDLDVGNNTDSSNASDDWTSNGVIIWDPVNKIVGAATIVMDLSVVGVDLIAKPESMIVTRTRGNDSLILSQASGYNALPGDILHFSVPAQNRGVLNSPPTEMEITTPDGTTVRGALPALAPYSEARVDVNWTVPSNTAIGDQTLTFMVDPDNLVTADANRSNNAASLDIFIGRMPVADMTLIDNVYTFENVSIDASASYDIDGGSVTCYFEIQDGVRTQFIDSPNCQAEWAWADDGDWEVKVLVVDDELDEIEMSMNATILNRDPYVNLTTMTPVVNAGSSITFNASDSGDLDTISPIGQHVTITWPGSACEEGLYGPYCTFSPEEEGIHQIEVIVTDDDNSSVSDIIEFEVMNVAPTIGEMQFSIDGIPYLPAEDGTWSIDEDVVATLQISGNDTLSDKESLLITWYPDDYDQNLSSTTSGPDSTITTSWSKSGLHTIRAFVTDNDGIVSEDSIGYVRVNNIEPVLDSLPAQTALFEDEILYLNASATDIADADVLMFCWDLKSSEDSDNNGIATDDCDIEGPDLMWSWTRSGLKNITVNVWDDDNATDSLSVAVTIVNRPPTAVISGPESIVIEEGDKVTFSGAESSDTDTDKANLDFIWDDPNTEGAAEDGSGVNYTITFDTPGTYKVNLTVIDDDGKMSYATVTVVVEPEPVDSLLGMSNTVVATSIIAIIIVLLVIVLLIRVGKNDGDIIETKSMPDYGWDTPVAQTPEPEPVAPQAVNTGPPIPSTGLPEGWTMEQWSYYGEQYLASLPPAPEYSQPEPAYSQPDPAATQYYSEPAPSLLNQTMVQEPAPTPASQALADLLDDLEI
ncbi:MAG: PKD domain-containing protein [Candidatus Poseidoniales archaeon]|nr:MAG: PKD domain-containing protein [Candidatus Poseidoniales archaeon]